MAHASGKHRQSASSLALHDWHFDRSEYLRLQALHGPFSLNAVNMTIDELLKIDFAGHRTWCIPPFASMHRLWSHYMSCKARAPDTTSLLVVLPVRPYLSSLVAPLTRLIEYPSSCSLFTRSEPTELQPDRRVPVRPLPYALAVYLDAPTVATSSSPPAALASLVEPSLEPAASSSYPELAYVSTRVAPPNPEASPLLIVLGTVDGHTVKVLIDCGASRNFAGFHAIQRLALPPARLSAPLRVKLANGTIATTDLSVHAHLTLADHGEAIPFCCN